MEATPLPYAGVAPRALGVAPYALKPLGVALPGMLTGVSSQRERWDDDDDELPIMGVAYTPVEMGVAYTPVETGV